MTRTLLGVFLLALLQVIYIDSVESGVHLTKQHKNGDKLLRNKRQTLSDLLKRYEASKKQKVMTTTMAMPVELSTAKRGVARIAPKTQTINTAYTGPTLNMASNSKGVQKPVQGVQQKRPAAGVSIFEAEDGRYKVDDRRTHGKATSQQNSPVVAEHESIFTKGLGKVDNKIDKVADGDLFHKKEIKMHEQVVPQYQGGQYNTGGIEGHQNQYAHSGGEGQSYGASENLGQGNENMGEVEEDEYEEEEENSPGGLNNNGTNGYEYEEEEGEEATAQHDTQGNIAGKGIDAVQLEPASEQVKYKGGDIFVTPEVPKTNLPQNSGTYIHKGQPYYIHQQGGDIFAQPAQSVQPANTRQPVITNTPQKNVQSQTGLSGRDIERLITNLQGGDIFTPQAHQQGKQLAMVDQGEQESDSQDNEVLKNVVTSDHVGPHASTAFGIVIGILIALVFVVGPLICFVYQYRQKRLEKQKRQPSSRFFNNNRDNGIMEAMLMSELGREMTIVNHNAESSSMMNDKHRNRNHRKLHNGRDTPTMSDFEGGRYSPTCLP